MFVGPSDEVVEGELQSVLHSLGPLEGSQSLYRVCSQVSSTHHHSDDDWTIVAASWGIIE